MTAQVIDGTAAARQVREDVAKGVAGLVADGGAPPGSFHGPRGPARPAALARSRVARNSSRVRTST
jgi:hypothetical protein